MVTLSLLGEERPCTFSSCTISPASQSRLTSREDDASQKQLSDTLACKSNTENPQTKGLRQLWLMPHTAAPVAPHAARAVCGLKSTDDRKSKELEKSTPHLV